MLSSIPELFTLLGRDPSELVGQPETVWLEFKKAPYQLQNEHHKFELAKDVTAMANADGGVILIGVETQREEASQEDMAIALRPVSPGLVDAQQMKNVISEWVFPRLDVDVNHHPVEGDNGELWSIFIQRGGERDSPFIVAKDFVGEAGPDRNLFAVFERSGSHNRPYEPAQVHGWINGGFRALLDEPEREAAPAAEEGEQVLVEDYLRLRVPEQAATYYIQAAPEDVGRLSHFYRGDLNDSLYQRLIRPRHHLRSHGFNLPGVSQPERTHRGALRVVWTEEDSISVTPGGLTTAIQGQRQLSWASEKYAKENECWINPLALVEFTLDFCRFFLSEVLSRGQSTKFSWRAGMRGLVEGSVRLFLPERIDHWAQPQQATQDAFDSDWHPAVDVDPNGMAYLILGEIYAQFGFDVSVIPYTEGETVSEEAILAVR